MRATTPFGRADLAELREHAPSVVQRYVPQYEAEYEKRGWRMYDGIARVYDNSRARTELGWQPKTDFACIIERLRKDEPLLGSLAEAIGAKGYHEEKFADGPYPVA